MCEYVRVCVCVHVCVCVNACVSMNMCIFIHDHVCVSYLCGCVGGCVCVHAYNYSGNMPRHMPHKKMQCIDLPL